MRLRSTIFVSEGDGGRLALVHEALMAEVC